MTNKAFVSRSVERGIVLFFALAACTASAAVKLPAIFSDHMVLQSGIQVPVWGWAKPQEDVTVEIGGQKLISRADAKGDWRVVLEPLKPGARLTMTVRGENTNVVNDVLAGEVWLGSGQSNMRLEVSRANNFEQEKMTANIPEIRMFTVSKNATMTLATDCRGSWKVCSPETVGNYSAALYFFGRELHQRLGVPVGLINSSFGGTFIQTWISMDAQRRVPELKPCLDEFEKSIAVPFDNVAAEAEFKAAMDEWAILAAKNKAEGKAEPRKPVKRADPRVDQNSPANLFNGMIAPLIPYRIKGVLWYQGEQNAGSDTMARANVYRIQLPTLIRDWRARWHENDLPFCWVQLPGLGKRPNGFDTESGFELVREGMLETLSLPNTGMTVNIDLGDPDNIHPKNKQDVGHRLALWALAQVYHRDIPFSGPIYSSCETNGAEIKIHFAHTDGGLVCHGVQLKAIGIAGADKMWHPADAKIEGNALVVFSKDVPHPVAVRYGWAKDPECNLYNGAGLPASPFRTDRWP
jgi:sialate O-acetylesterase